METPVASILWFFLVVALIPVVLWGIKRLPAVKASQSAPTRVVGVMALSGSQRVITVEVGQGEERRWLVLGVSPSSINLLHTMEPQAEAAVPTAAHGASFADTLKRLRNPQQGQP